MLKKFLFKWLLPKLVSRSCDSRIPRSGEEGEKVNCFVVALDRDDQPYFMATSYEDKALGGLKWNGERYGEDHSLSLNDLNDGKIRITHYYGLSEVVYSSVFDLAWNYILKFVYLKIRVYRHFSSANQYFFNKKKLVAKKRIELLQFMMGNQLDREHSGVGVVELMTKLYSIKWVLHPSKGEQKNKLELYLESLIDSGELIKVNDEYVVTGKAISTIEKYEEEERRHAEAVKLQKKMVLLTVLLAFLAIVQSGIIKLPVLLDFTDTITNGAHNKQMHPMQEKRG